MVHTPWGAQAQVGLYLWGSVDIEHQGVVPGDHAPAPGATSAPLVPDELQEAAHDALVGPRRRPFLKPESAASEVPHQTAQTWAQGLMVPIPVVTQLASGRAAVGSSQPELCVQRGRCRQGLSPEWLQGTELQPEKG